jgi:hypothetical protein
MGIAGDYGECNPVVLASHLLLRRVFPTHRIHPSSRDSRSLPPEPGEGNTRTITFAGEPVNVKEIPRYRLVAIREDHTRRFNSVINHMHVLCQYSTAGQSIVKTCVTTRNGLSGHPGFDIFSTKLTTFVINQRQIDAALGGPTVTRPDSVISADS